MLVDDSASIDSERTDDEKIIGENFTKRYRDIYKKKQIDEEKLNQLLQNLDWRLTDDESAEMSGPISAEEVLQILIDLPSEKSPGPDGLSEGVYKTLGLYLAKIFNKISEKGNVPESYRLAHVTLLPKEADPYNTGLYRPISLTNADYKIMTRIWAKRLDKVLKKHIGHHQRGFISERDGRENILMVQMLMEDRDTRGLPGASVFLDIAKAFDSVSHESLIHLLKHIGFPRRFISTVMAIYGTEADAKKNEVNFIIDGH